MSSDAIVIRARDVSKHYVMFARPEDRLKQMVVPRLQRALGRPPARYYRDFAALNGVSFDIRRGETVGIIGRNGSGKSTLLQIICGTLQPTSGSVEINGRVAALLELGAGFNPEFTGRENAYLNAAILGLSRAETDARFDAIARFADIGDFIDQPIKTYSSGMYVRLAFATAINVDPDILVVDEALAVGDEAFQRKCFARIEQIKERGGTILFVSHAAQTIVQLCDRAMLIDAGEKLLEGEPKRVVGQYQRLINASAEQALAAREDIRTIANQPTTGEQNLDMAATATAGRKPTDSPAQPKDRPSIIEAYDSAFVSQTIVEFESKGAKIENVHVVNSNGNCVNILEAGRAYAVRFSAAFETSAQNVGFGMMIKGANGIEIGGTGTSLKGDLIKVVHKSQKIEVTMNFKCILASGVYFINVGVGTLNNGHEVVLHKIIDAIPIRVITPEKPMFSGLVNFAIEYDLEWGSKPSSSALSVRTGED